MNELSKEDATTARERRSMEHDMMSANWLIEKVKANNNSYANQLYAAMCNMGWQRMDVFPILKDEYWSCSWRYAGGIISRLRDEGDYLDWYCSGNEGTVTDEIRADLAKIGWQPFDY
jgi:hypothetical protein